MFRTDEYSRNTKTTNEPTATQQIRQTTGEHLDLEHLKDLELSKYKREPKARMWIKKTLDDKNVVHGEKSDFLGQLTEKIRGCGVSFYIWTKKVLKVN